MPFVNKAKVFCTLSIVSHLPYLFSSCKVPAAILGKSGLDLRTWTACTKQGKIFFFGVLM